MKEITLYIMAILYIFAGVWHFVKPKVYMRMMPPFLPAHKLLVYASGFAEFVLGALLLVPAYRSYAAYGIMALLIAVFPANVYMLTSGKFKIPKLLLILRLPLQIALILWAWWYT